MLKRTALTLLYNGFCCSGPDHYMQFLYLRDETGAIRAVAKFEHTDTVFPFVFPASAVEGAAELTPYSVDVIHGVWKGQTLPLAAL